MTDNKTLAARRKARESTIEVGGHHYTVRRPKAAELLDDMTALDLSRRFVVGWDLKNSDLIPGGDPDPEPFEQGLWEDWLEDNPELWEPVSKKVIAMVREHEAALEGAAKN